MPDSDRGRDGTPPTGGGGSPSRITITASRPQDDLSQDRLLKDLPRDGQGRPVLGRISIISRIGKGGMGAVYYAIHPRLNIEVAVKVLPHHLVEEEPRLVDRFFSEARMAVSLENEHVVRVYDVDSEGETHFIVMQYVAGESAGALVKRVGRVPEADALAVVRAATRGLAAAHARGIIHRDIKPDNILIPNRQLTGAKLADLGLAKPEGGGQSLGTQSHVAMGTPGYMAPEQIEDAKTAGPAADVFSMGATLYALLAGRAPFRGSSLGVVLRETATKDAEPLPAHVSASTREIIARCLQKDASRRYANGADLLVAMEELSHARVATEPTLVPAQEYEKTRIAPKRHRRLPMVLATLVLVILAGVIGLTLVAGLSDPVRSGRGSFERPVGDTSGPAIAAAKLKAQSGDLEGALAAIEGIPGQEAITLRDSWRREADAPGRMERERQKRLVRDRLARIQKQLDADNDSILAGDDGKWLATLEGILEREEAGLVKATRERSLPPGGRFTASELRRRLLDYYKDLVALCTERLDRIAPELATGH